MVNKKLDTRNVVSTTRLEAMIKVQVEALMEHPEDAHVLAPLMIWGAPGVGKSTIIRSVAEELGIGFIDIRLAQREPVDIRGLPVPSDDGVKWLVASEWPRDPQSKGIILFDELTAADRTLQVAAYELILDRRLGELYTLPNGWYICAAGNRIEDRAVSTSLSSALANRFMHVELQEDAVSWLLWAAKNEIHPSVTGYIGYRPDMLFSQEGQNLERGWPSPRSWERVSKTVFSAGKTADADVFEAMVKGLVGVGVGSEFWHFHLETASSLDVLKLMKNPNAVVELPDKPDQKFAFAAVLSYYVWRGSSSEETKVLVDGFLRLSEQMTSDFACMALSSALVGTHAVSKSDATKLLYASANFKPWQKKHGNALVKWNKKY